MKRSIRCLLPALFLLASGFAAAPVAAQGPPPGPVFTFPVPFILQVDAVGAGGTEAEALNNALTELRATYIVLRYDITSSICAPVDLPGQPEFELCGVWVHAWVLRKAWILH